MMVEKVKTVDQWQGPHGFVLEKGRVQLASELFSSFS